MWPAGIAVLIMISVKAQDTKSSSPRQVLYVLAGCDKVAAALPC